jgi:cytochrome c
VKIWLASLFVVVVSCHPQDERTARQLTSGGDAERGKTLIRAYGCGSCHVVPGVDTATGRVGPPLSNIAERVYLAGQLPNTADNLQRWIRDPQSIENGTAMPNLNVSEPDARDMAAYLYTMRE